MTASVVFVYGLLTIVQSACSLHATSVAGASKNYKGAGRRCNVT